MNPHLKPIHCRRFATRVKQLRGEIPAGLQRLLDAFDAVEQWSPDIDPDSIGRAIMSGAFTADTAGAYLTAELNRPANDPAAVKQQTTTLLARAFGLAVNKDAADAVIESLRPTFDQARDGFDTAIQWITPSTTAEQVLEAGGEVADAWRALAQHRRTLDALHQFVSELVLTFGAAPRQPFMITGDEIAAAFFVSEDRDLVEAARALDPVRGSSLRGGRWIGLRTIMPLQWNTLTVARSVIDSQQAAYAERNRRQHELTHS